MTCSHQWLNLSPSDKLQEIGIKYLYGLKQASRNWYKIFTSSLHMTGFKQSQADLSLFCFKQSQVDYSLFIFITKKSFVAALIYVDDVIVLGNDMKKIQETKTFLDERFSIKDLGPLKYFVGVDVTCTQDSLVLNQRK